MLHDQISRMIRAMIWANEQEVAMLDACPAAQAEGLPLLGHILGAEHRWLTRLRREQPTHPVWPTLALAECADLTARNAAAFAEYLGGVAEADLARPVQFQGSNGQARQIPAVDILTHVVVHGAYHRGQIARVLKRFGVQATNTDHIDFAELVEPKIP